MRNTRIDTLRDVLRRLEKEGAALGHFNVADHVLLKAVVAAAAELKRPVLVGASEGEREFFGARQLAALVKSLRQESDVPIFLNADHTHSLAKAMEAANAGFDAVGGGIDKDTAPLVVDAGANVLVAGTSVFGTNKSVAASMEALRNAVTEVTL